MYENFNAKQMRIKSLDNEIKKVYNFIHQEANQGNYQVVVPYAITKECINELNKDGYRITFNVDANYTKIEW